MFNIRDQILLKSCMQLSPFLKQTYTMPNTETRSRTGVVGIEQESKALLSSLEPALDVSSKGSTPGLGNA